MSRCEVFKEQNDIYIYIYIYVTTSVTNFGEILFTPNMHTAEFCFAVDSWRSGLRCAATVVPSSPLKSRSFIRQHIPAAHLLLLTLRFQTQHVLFMAQKGVERRLNISISLWNKQELLTRKFSVAYCNAYSQTSHTQKLEISTKIDVYRYSRSHWRALVELQHSVGVVGQ